MLVACNLVMDLFPFSVFIFSDVDAWNRLRCAIMRKLGAAQFDVAPRLSSVEAQRASNLDHHEDFF